MDRTLNDGWFDLSLIEQMVNIGLEVKRAFRFDNDAARRNAFLDKAIKATELTVKDPKNAKVVPELKISKEVLEDYKGEHLLDTSKEQILNYYSYFFELLQNRPAGHRAARP